MSKVKSGRMVGGARRRLHGALLCSTALIAAGLAQQANAQGYTGQTVEFQYLFGNSGEAYDTPATAVVGTGFEFSPLVIGGTNYFNLDVSSNQLTVVFATGVSWNDVYAFNGFRLRDLGSAPNILGFSFNSGLSTGGVPAPVTSFNSNDLFINWQGLQYELGETLVFDVAFTPLCASLTTGDDVCAITSSTGVFGTADALAGIDTVQLGGATNFSFNADTLGVNFTNFEQVRKTGASTVTLTGSAELPVYVDQGVLRVAGSVANASGDAIVIDGAGATVQVLAGGTITGGSIGVNGGAGVSVDNAGTITGANGNAIWIQGAGTIVNSGTLNGASANYNAVYVAGGGSLDNTVGATITGGYDGVYFGGAASITNAGTITSRHASRVGLFLQAGGTVDNAASGTISGGATGLYVASGALDLDNAGEISGGSYGVIAQGGGTLTNAEGASISGGFRGVYGGGPLSVTNDGLIEGLVDNGVTFFGAGSSLTNSATGVIAAGRTTGGWGVYGNESMSVDNAGEISGEQGVVFWNGGTLVNRAGGVIDGRLFGVKGDMAGVVAVENAGTISGDYGVHLGVSGDVANTGVITGDGNAGLMFMGASNLLENSGSITSVSSWGVRGWTGADWIENAGEISGGQGAVTLEGGNDTLVLFSGATLGGLADGGADVDTLVLAGTGTDALDVSTVANFEVQSKIGSGTWTLTGAAQGSAGWTVSEGTLRVAGGAAVADTGGVEVAAGATFALDADETIGALSGAGTVDLGGSTLTVGGDGGDSTFDGVIADGGLSFVGQWRVSDGPLWTTNPAVYSGQEAAALLFGGEAGDYSISTVSSDPDDVDFQAWMDGYADIQYLNTPAPQNLHVDAGGDGYQVPGGSGTSYSAYVNDNELYVGGDPRINYAFRNETGSLVKTGAGVLTLTGANTFSGSAIVQQGTLRIGGDERLSDRVWLQVETGATFDLQGYDETVSEARLKGTLAGTGTLTAAEYFLNGATVDANLGEGVIYTVGGVSVLNGTAGANGVYVAAGALRLGADERLDDEAVLAVSEGAEFDLAGFDETVRLLQAGGTLSGTGTLTADEYWLLGGTVGANLGEGVLLNIEGVNVLNGTAGADLVSVTDGTLTLGAAERLDDEAVLLIGAEGEFDLGAFDETVGRVSIDGLLSGTGTLTAAEYALTGATIDANLGAGELYNVGGSSVLNGTAGAEWVEVAYGRLTLGADERLNDDATLYVAMGAAFDTGGFDETVALAQVRGSITGSGRLTADEYQLDGATIDADLGEGELYNLRGVSVLNGASAAGTVGVVAGTLQLGGDDRLWSGALVQVEEDATLDLDGWDQTLDQLWGEGVVDLGEGGDLTLGWGDASSAFGGIITGEGDVAKIGGGTFTLLGEHDFDGDLIVEEGELRLAAVLAGGLTVNGGLLSGVGDIGGALVVTGGTVSPGGGFLTPDAAVSPGLGTFFADSLSVSGGTMIFGFAGADLGWASDGIGVAGAVSLSGGLVDARPVSDITEYSFNQQYLLIEGASLTGEFANLGDFTQNAYEGQLYQRLRYDLVPGGVVLEVRRMIDWSAEAETGLQGTVGEALEGTQMDGSDEWAEVLNTLMDLTPEERREALEDMSGEGLANVATSTLAFGDRFQSVMQGRMGPAGAGAGGGIGGGSAFAALPFGQGARTDVLGGVLGVAEAGADTRPGGWAEAFVVDSELQGRGGAADAHSDGGGFATGVDFQAAPGWRVGFALGFSDMQADTSDRATQSEARFWHVGAFASYAEGPWYAGAAFSRMTGDVDVNREIRLGPITLDVVGATDVKATNLSVNAGRRFRLGEATELRAGFTATGSQVRQGAYTETGAFGLSLDVAEVDRRLFVGELGGRVTHDMNGGRLKPYVGAGAAFAAGDMESLISVGFTGAPTGTGTFVVGGAELPPSWAKLEAGLGFKPRDNVWVSVGYDGALAERLQEHRGALKVSVKW